MELNSKTDEVVKVEPNAETNSFKKVIEKSKQNVRAAQAKKLEKKRGRGRPRNEDRAEAKRARPSGETLEQAAPISSEPVGAPPPNLAPFLKAPLQMISKIPATNYKIPELALDDTEAMLCAESLNHIVQAFVPDVGAMNPKTAALVMGLSTFGSIGFQKYSIFRSEMQKRSLEAAPSEAPVAGPVTPSNVDAGQYFSQVRG